MVEFGNDYASTGWGETEKEKQMSKGDLPNFLKVENGQTVDFRVVGRVPIEISMHWKAHPDRGALVCLKTGAENSHCPICDYVASAGNKSAEAQSRNYIYVIDKRDNTVKVWNFSYTVRKDLRSILNNRPDIANAPNQLDDFLIRITRNGVGLTTTYNMVISQQASPIAEEEKSLIVNLKPLQEVYKPKSVEELNQLFNFRQSGSSVGPAPQQSQPQQQPQFRQVDFPAPAVTTPISTNNQSGSKDDLF